jgi:hypothetical protein
VRGRGESGVGQGMSGGKKGKEEESREVEDNEWDRERQIEMM